MKKPCLICGDLSPQSRCPEHTLKNTPRPRGHIYDTPRWRRLSAAARRASPACEIPGCQSTDLTTDHIIPVSIDPSLALEPLNTRVICRRHNGMRANTCTDTERQAVLDAIAARRRRLAARS